MELEGSERDGETVVSQVSFGGFDSNVRAKDLVECLEYEVGTVFRCRLKTSWTPPESYPTFEVIDTSDIEIEDDYKKVEPHAFVHFATPKSVDWAVDAAGRCGLFLNKQPLMVSLGLQSPFHLRQRRRTTTPHKLSDVLEMCEKI